jgi:phage tail-like protein
MPPGESVPLGQALRFHVQIDGGNAADLGDWNKCDGLTVEYEIKEYQEGGNNDYVHRLPGRVKYQNIKLTRTLNEKSSEIASWVSSNRTSFKRQNARIAALDTEGKQIASWNLTGVYPVKWTGPSFDISTNQGATESLELAHNGFMR